MISTLHFNDWIEKCCNIHFADNEQMERAYNKVAEIIPCQLSFKHRPEEIKKMFNHKFNNQ